MARAVTSLLIVPLLLFQGAGSNQDTPKPYEDDEAYAVYSAILLSEWPVRVAHAKTLIIQTETTSYDMCLRPEKEWEEKVGPAISDYLKVNAKPSLLQRRMNIDIPYQLIALDKLRSVIKTGRWEGFYQQYPDSGGWIQLSAVGFNADKTVAVVYVAHHCGSLCGEGRFHVLEKKGGRWEPLEWKGASCVWVS